MSVCCTVASVPLLLQPCEPPQGQSTQPTWHAESHHTPQGHIYGEYGGTLHAKLAELTDLVTDHEIALKMTERLVINSLKTFLSHSPSDLTFRGIHSIKT